MGKFLGCSTLSMASEGYKRSLQVPSTVLNWFLKSKEPKKRGQSMDDVVQKNGGVRRVKLVFTRKEAAQLLAMYVGGQDAMMFDMIASDIERKEAKEGSRSGSGGWKPALESIPED